MELLLAVIIPVIATLGRVIRRIWKLHCLEAELLLRGQNSLRVCLNVFAGLSLSITSVVVESALWFLLLQDILQQQP